MNWLKKEPSLIIAGIMSVLAVAITFGLPLTGEQKDVIETALWAIVPLIFAGGAVTRGLVYSPATVEKLTAGRHAAPTNVFSSDPTDAAYHDGSDQ